MRIDFDDDPEHGSRDLPYCLYGLVFIVALAIAVAIGWFLYVDDLGAYVP
jgi:hypothetical protein